MAASPTVAAMGATWSIVHDRLTIPPVGTAPWVALIPTTPERAAGTRMLARVSVPREARAMPVATEIADPPLEPPGMRVGSWGLRLCGVVTPRANSWVLALPTITAPARRSMATAGASSCGQAAVGQRAGPGHEAGDVDDVLDRDRHPVQRAPPPPGRPLGVGGGGVGEGLVGVDLDHGGELGVAAVDGPQAGLDQLDADETVPSRCPATAAASGPSRRELATG